MTDGEGMPAMDLPGFEDLAGAELVQRLPLFRTLGFEETRKLFAIAHPVQRAEGEVLIEQHALGTALYVVKSGVVDIFRDDELIGKCGAGELLGEMSLIDDVLTSTKVVATEPCEFYAIERRRFDELMERDPPLAVKVYKAFCRTLSDRLRVANSQLDAIDDESEA